MNWLRFIFILCHLSELDKKSTIGLKFDERQWMIVLHLWVGKGGHDRLLWNCRPRFESCHQGRIARSAHFWFDDFWCLIAVHCLGSTFSSLRSQCSKFHLSESFRDLNPWWLVEKRKHYLCAAHPPTPPPQAPGLIKIFFRRCTTS